MEKKLLNPNAYDSCVIYITTDGEENSSKHFSAKKIKRMIEEAENNFNIAIKKVFSQLNKKDKFWKNKKIKARFICALTIYWPNGKFFSSVGKIDGRISKSKKGKLGFGYDPIFIPRGKELTFGEISRSAKAKIDHRMKAYKNIKKFF